MPWLYDAEYVRQAWRTYSDGGGHTLCPRTLARVNQPHPTMGNASFNRSYSETRPLMLRLTDLREILRYVPRFRDRVFVIALDGAIVEDDNFRNLLLDIALLRSLSIRVALVH